MDNIKLSLPENLTNIRCPLCNEDCITIAVHDYEGNFHGLVGCEYEKNPWSGLTYGLCHSGWSSCLLCTDGFQSMMGGKLYDTLDEAIADLEMLYGKHKDEKN